MQELIKDIQDLLDRAKTGEFSKPLEKKKNVTLPLREALSEINAKCISGIYNK